MRIQTVLGVSITQDITAKSEMREYFSLKVFAKNVRLESQ